MTDFVNKELVMCHSTNDEELDGLSGKIIGKASDGFWIVLFPVVLERGYSAIVLSGSCIKRFSDC